MQQPKKWVQLAIASILILANSSLYAQLTVTSMTTDVFCQGGASGEITAQPSGGTPPYTYAWNTGETTQTISNLMAGCYAVTVTDALGATATDYPCISDPPLTYLDISGSSTVSCDGENVTLTAIVSGHAQNAGPFTYQWLRNSAYIGGTGSSINTSISGWYKFEMMDANGCFYSIDPPFSIGSPFFLDAGTSPTLSIAPADMLSVCAGDNGSFTVNASPSGTYTYDWSNGSTGSTMTTNVAGSYYVTVTDPAEGCAAVDTVQLNNFSTSISTSSTNVTCNGGSDGTITASATGGNAPYTYLWPDGQSNATATGLIAGCYELTVTDACSEQTTALTCVTEPTVLFGTITPSAPAICDGNPVLITSNISGGTPPYSYQWYVNTVLITGANAPNYSTTTAGSHVLELVDANGCIYSSPAINLGSGTTPNVSVTPSSATVCLGDLSTFTASASPAIPTDYNWSNSHIGSAMTTAVPGIYNVTASDASEPGCFSSTSVQLNNYPQSTAQITASGTSSFCVGDSITLYANNTGTGPYLMQWFNATTGIPLTAQGAQDSLVVSYTGDIVYDLLDGNGCSTHSDTVSTSVLPTNPVTISSSHPSGLACAGDTVTYTASATGAIGYQWSTGATTATIEVYTAGTYEVTATFSNGCSSTESVILIYNPTLSLTAAVSSNYNGADVSCNGTLDGEITAATAGGTAPYNYQWSTGYGGGGSTFAVHSNLAAGTYTVTVTDANGCTELTTLSLTEPSAVTATIVSAVNTVCGSACTAEATAAGSGGTGAYTYLWSNGQTTTTATALCQGAHIVTVTDANGCIASDFTPVNSVSSNLTVTVTEVDASCFGQSDGSLTANPTGGSAPYTFLWDDGQTTATAANLATGNYCVTVTDDNGCETIGCGNVGQPALLSVVIDSTIDVLCNGAASGSVYFSGIGGTPPYMHSLDGSNFSVGAFEYLNLSAGSYTITIMDGSGCIATAPFVISEPPAVVATITSIVNVDCLGDCTGVATVAGTAGTGTYAYQWSDGQTTATATGLCASTYQVTVTDANACVDVENVTITEPTTSVSATAAVTSNYNGADVSCNGSCDGEATAAAAGGTLPYAYIWDALAANQTTATATGLCAGTSYTVTITDAAGCQEVASVLLTEPITLMGTVSSSVDVSCNAGSDGALTVSATGGLAPYTFDIGSSAQSSGNFNNLSAGIYSVTLTDVNGCQTTTTHTILEPSVLIGQDTSYFVAPDSTLDFCVPYPSTALNTTVVSTVVNGTLLDNGGGCFSYTPTNLAEAMDTLIIQVCDTGTTFEHQIIAYTASCVWAGDTDTNQVANNLDLLPIGVNYGIIGDPRPNADLNWDCEPMRDWNVVSSGSVDPKHSDTNGDGIVDDNDTLAITLNWGQVYVKNSSPLALNGTPIYVDTIAAAPGDTVQIPLVLGTSLLPATDVYGVAFTIVYDNSIVDTNSVSMDYSNSWLGTDGLDMITIEKDFYPQGEIEVGMSRIDHVNVSGSGAIAYIQLTIKDDVLKSNLLRMDFDVKDVKLIDSSGAVLAIAPQATSSVVLVSSMQQSYRDLGFEIFPNPTNGVINLNLPASDQQILQLFNVHGQLLQSWQVDAENQMQIDLGGYPSATYFLELQTEDGVETKRIIKVR